MGEGSVDGGDEFAAHIDSIDTFTLESDVDTQLFQFTDILKAVFGVAAKREIDLTRIWSIRPRRSPPSSAGSHPA